MSDVMSRDDKGRHYGMQNDRKNRGKMGGFVTDKCKREGLCFICKKEGKRVKGSARFHPNHLPQNTKNNSGKVAATEVLCETDSDSDLDKKSKN
jgi:hypothetical protein